MKSKNYEKTMGIYLLIIILIIIIVVFFITLCNVKISNYHLLNGIVYTDDLLLFVVDEKERDLLYQNAYFYIDNKKYKYSINEDKGICINKNNLDYYEMTVKTKINNKYKINDSVDVSIKEKRIKAICIFKIIWEDD